MYGWRAKLGLILPANNTVTEPELGGNMPLGVSVHATKVVARGVTPQERVAFITDSIPDARDALMDSRLNAMSYGCMMRCRVKGAEWEEDTCKSLGTSDVSFQTPGRALRSALDALEVRRISVFSPYSDEVALMVPAYFEAAGLEVVANVNRRDLFDPQLVVNVHPEDLFREIASVPPADALCILPTDLPTFQILETLEKTWGGPVVTSNLAIFWSLLRATSVPDALPGLGVLGQVTPMGGA
jgi:arylmalonate decarboxylase